MPNKTLEALYLGDICGKPGYRAIFIGLKKIIRDRHIDIVAVNGENAADGFGITPEIAEQLFQSGVHMITSGNHIWQKDEILPYLEREQRILRPANYPPGVKGKGAAIISIHGTSVGIINLQGRVSMPVIDCPFRCAKDIIGKMRSKTPIILIDFHAEAPDEKEALANYLDGKVSLIVGTHTHVQTADEKIMPKGTGYITDLGITGPSMSVIGSVPSISLQRQLTQLPIKNEIADTTAIIQGVHCSIDVKTGKALNIKRVCEILTV